MSENCPASINTQKFPKPHKYFVMIQKPFCKAQKILKSSSREKIDAVLFTVFLASRQVKKKAKCHKKGLLTDKVLLQKRWLSLLMMMVIRIKKKFGFIRESGQKKVNSWRNQSGKYNFLDLPRDSSTDFYSYKKSKRRFFSTLNLTRSLFFPENWHCVKKFFSWFMGGKTEEKMHQKVLIIQEN